MTWRPVEGGEPPPNTSLGAGPFHRTPRERHFLPLKPQVPKQQRHGGGGGGGQKRRKLRSHSPIPAPRLPQTARSPFSACSPERDGAPVSPPRSRDPGPPRAARRETWEVRCETPGCPWAPQDFSGEKLPKPLDLLSFLSPRRVVSTNPSRGQRDAGR